MEAGPGGPARTGRPPYKNILQEALGQETSMMKKASYSNLTVGKYCGGLRALVACSNA